VGFPGIRKNGLSFSEFRKRSEDGEPWRNITEEIRFSTLKGLNPILLFSIRAILREKATRA